MTTPSPESLARAKELYKYVIGDSSLNYKRIVPAIALALDTARLEEREACAKIAETSYITLGYASNNSEAIREERSWFKGEQIATAIRNRGK